MVVVVFDPPLEGVGLVGSQVSQVPRHLVGSILETHAVAHVIGVYLEFHVSDVDAWRVGVFGSRPDIPASSVEHVHVDVQVKSNFACPLVYCHINFDVARAFCGVEIPP